MKAIARTRIFPVIILVLAVFAGLKATNVWFGFSVVDAQTGALSGAAGEAVNGPNTEDPARTGAPKLQDAPPPQLLPGEVERRILENLAGRRASIEKREEELAAREAVLSAAELRLDDKIAAYETERAALTAMREEKDAGDSAEIASIVSAYERMKPKDAAVIFNALDEEILVPLAAGMRTQALSGVLAEMMPENARRLTKLLAERGNIGDDIQPSAGEIQ